MQPIVIITSNNEKELPDAFLRRCVFYYIRVPDTATMRAIVELHYPGIKPKLVEEAMRSFFSLRETPGLKKKPTTSELLDWLKLLLNEDVSPETLREREAKKLISTLAWRAAQERTGRAPVREARFPEPPGKAIGSRKSAFAKTRTPLVHYERRPNATRTPILTAPRACALSASPPPRAPTLSGPPPFGRCWVSCPIAANPSRSFRRHSDRPPS